MSQRPSIKRPKNPCTGVCRIDKSTGLCRGCWRTRAEIKGWKRLSEAGRDGVLAAIDLRRHRTHGDAAGAAPTPGVAERPGAVAASVSPALHLSVQPVQSVASPPQADQTRTGAPQQWRHRKSGRIVTELHRARSKAKGLRKNAEMVVYRDERGRVWVRPAVEFDDGRFVPI